MLFIMLVGSLPAGWGQNCRTDWLVGAHYYGWYRPHTWEKAHFRAYPEYQTGSSLGYSSFDEAVVAQQIQAAEKACLGYFIVRTVLRRNLELNVDELQHLKCYMKHAQTLRFALQVDQSFIRTQCHVKEKAFLLDPETRA